LSFIHAKTDNFDSPACVQKEKMLNTPKVNLKVVSKDNAGGVFEITPLIKGFGHTIGSALRRTLYSATEGAAITRVSIDGVTHQFSTIEGVKDDILQILLNLKRIRFKKSVKEDVVLELDAKGSCDVKAGDIEAAAGVEIINKDLVITSLASKKTLKAKLTVTSGFGYKPADESASVPHGVLLLDANYSPIVNVVTAVDTTRVGDDPNYDKLAITVTTDGTIDAEDAIREAASKLKEFFYKIQTGRDYTAEEEKLLEDSNAEEDSTPKIPVDEVALEELHLPTRTINALRKAGIKTLGDLADRTEDELLRVRNLGEKSIREIISLLEKEGLR